MSYVVNDLFFVFVLLFAWSHYAVGTSKVRSKKN